MLMKDSDFRKVSDDLGPFDCKFIDYSTSSRKFTIKIWLKSEPSSKWEIYKRYSEFESFKQKINSDYFGIDFPPKIYGPLTPTGLIDRMTSLEIYSKNIFHNWLLSNSVTVISFFCPHLLLDDRDLSCKASMVLRSFPEWSITKDINISWRSTKLYSVVKSCNSHFKNVNFLMQLMIQGPNFVLNEEDMMLIIKTISSFKHPFILKYEHFSSTSSIVCIYSVISKGSLTDMIYGIKSPFEPYYRRFSKKSDGTKILLTKLQIYAKQILIALDFLHSSGLFHGHLHSGNVLVDNDVAKLSDIANIYSGLSSKLKPFFYDIPPFKSMKDLDIYSFGHLFFEMVVGSHLTTSFYNQGEVSIPYEEEVIICSILSKDVVHGVFPSAKQLLELDYFSGIAINQDVTESIRIPSNIPEILKRVENYVISKIRNDREKFLNAQSIELARTTTGVDSRDKLKRLASMQEPNELH